LLSNSAAPACNEIDRALPRKDPFTIQNPNPSQLEGLIQNLDLLLSEMNELERSSLTGAMPRAGFTTSVGHLQGAVISITCSVTIRLICEDLDSFENPQIRA